MWVDLFKNRISKDWETVVVPLLFVVIVFAFYSLLGYERELQWHSVRKGLEAVALLASVSIVTGCSMRRKLWYPSYLTLLHILLFILYYQLREKRMVYGL